MKRKIAAAAVVTAAVMLLTALTGCGAMKRLTRREAMGADEYISPWNIERTLTIKGLVGQCQYTVDSWSIYDSWEDAGIPEDRHTESPEILDGDEAGVMLVTITMYCESREEALLDAEIMAVNDLELFIPSLFDDDETDFDIMVHMGSLTNVSATPAYVDKPGTTVFGDFYIPIIQAGESVTFTLGYTLSRELIAAAKDGTLCIFYTSGGFPRYKEEYPLLSLGDES